MLAEEAGVSCSLIRSTEAPGTAIGFSLEVFFDIADALNVDAAELINASMFQDQFKSVKKNQNAFARSTVCTAGFFVHIP